MTNQDQDALKRSAAVAALNNCNCTEPLEPRAEVVAQYLDVVDGAVVVVDRNRQPRTVPCMLGSGEMKPLAIETLIGELLQTTPSLRWKQIDY